MWSKLHGHVCTRIREGGEYIAGGVLSKLLVGHYGHVAIERLECFKDIWEYVWALPELIKDATHEDIGSHLNAGIVNGHSG